MGNGFRLWCKSIKCLHSEEVFLGIGMLYPTVCEEIKQDILKGKYGAKWKKIVEEDPTASVDWEYDVFACKKCGHWINEPKITLFYRGGVKRWRYRCHKCGGLMKHAKIKDLRCNECGEELFLDMEDTINWD